MANSGDKFKILFAESEPEVLDSQAVSVQKAGHTVAKAVGRKAVEEAVRKEAYDLVILGSTLGRNDRHHLPYMVKKAQPEAKVLVMHADGGRHPNVDSFIDSGRSIEALTDAIAKLNKKEAPLAKGAASGK